MTFSYNQNIPNPPNDPADDVGIMQTNAQSIAGIIAVDHVGFNFVNGGTHNQVTFAINQAAPAPAIPAGAVADMYAGINAGQSWPFWQNALGRFQMLGQNTATANGTAFLPGGIILKWGFVNSTTNGSVTFSPVFPANAFNVTTQPNYTGSAPSSGGVATVAVLSPIPASGFTWKFLTPSGAYNGFYWFAVGN